MKKLVLLLAAAAAVLAFAGAASTVAKAGSNDGVFLCNSVYQVDPSVWPMTEATQLVKVGYWSPFAVSGVKEGGTNVGSYHLTCNLLAGLALAPVHGYVGAGGTVIGPDLHDQNAEILGWYPLVK